METRNTYFNKIVSNNPELPSRIGVFWTPKEEDQVLQLLKEEKSVEDIGKILERTTGSISSRIRIIACTMYKSGTPIETVLDATKLTDSELHDALLKYETPKIKKEKGSEEKALKKEPVQASLITIPKSDITELKLVMFEIRDLLKKIANKSV